MSIIHGVLAVWFSSGAAAESVTESAMGGLSRITGTALLVSVVPALLGGVTAFGRRRMGGIFLVLAAVGCLFLRDTRVYGVIYLLGGILAFFLRPASRRGNYEDEYADEEGYEDDDALEDEDEGRFPRAATPFGGVEGYSREAGRKERTSRSFASRIFRGSREEREPLPADREEQEEPAEPVRRRASKVCPACGASVGITHRFCFVCGRPLHIRLSASEPETPLPEERGVPHGASFTASAEDEAVDFSEIPVHQTPARPAMKKASFWGQEEEQGQETDEETEEQDEQMADTPERVVSERGRSANSEFESAGRFDDGRFEEGIIGDRGFEDRRLEGRLEGRMEGGKFEDAEPEPPRRVFVKSVQEEQPLPRRPLHISPDNSYREFSHYTRRRKRRNRSLLRRVLGIMVVLLACGGAGWFLLGLRRLPAPIPDASFPPVDTPADFSASPDTPVAVPDGPVYPDVISTLQINAPTRGVVVGSNVNVRSDHSTAGSVVTRLNADTQVEVLDRWEGTSGNLTGPWYQLRTGGREGWIYGQYFQPLDGREATLPAGYTEALLRTFGASRTEAVQQLGPPTRQTGTALTWTGLTIGFRGESEITRLQITSAKHVLQNGLAVGISVESLYRNMGYPSDYRGGQLRYLESVNRGVSVQLMKDGKVRSVTVGNI
jgi:hypothetical protein